MKMLNLAGLNTDKVVITYSVNQFIVTIDNVFSGSYYDLELLNEFLDIHNLNNVHYIGIAKTKLIESFLN